MGGDGQGGSEFVSHGKMSPVPDELKDSPDFTVIECIQGSEMQGSENSWKFVRVQEKKQFPNGTLVVESKLENAAASINDIIQICNNPKRPENPRKNNRNANFKNNRNRNGNGNGKGNGNRHRTNPGKNAPPSKKQRT